ncbi:MAG: hypothetical protein ABIE22_01615 [archaeon]
MRKIKKILETLKFNGVEKIISFSGGSDLDKKVRGVIEESIQYLSDKPVAILNGGTEGGTPAYSTICAKDYSLPVIGVFPSRGKKYLLPGLDFKIEVPQRYRESCWGDETEIFGKLSDGAIIIGGEIGTMHEFAYLMQINKSKLKRGEIPIYVAPIAGIQDDSCFSDIIPSLPIPLNVRSSSLPEQRFFTGREAAQFLIDKLKL